MLVGVAGESMAAIPARLRNSKCSGRVLPHDRRQRNLTSANLFVRAFEGGGNPSYAGCSPFEIPSDHHFSPLGVNNWRASDSPTVGCSSAGSALCHVCGCSSARTGVWASPVISRLQKGSCVRSWETLVAVFRKTILHFLYHQPPGEAS